MKVDGDATLKVQTNTGARLSGRFVVEGRGRDNSRDPSFPRVHISANRPLGKWGPSYGTEPVAAPQGTDHFELTGIRGPTVLHASLSGAALVSISRAGGEDIAGKTLDFTGTESIDDLVVVFTTDRAEVEVTVTGMREPDNPERVLVVLFSESPDRWHAGSVQYTAIHAARELVVQAPRVRGDARRSESAIRLQLGSVVPCRYLVAAVPNPGVMYPTQPGMLEKLRPLAVPVTLVADETAKVEVRVARDGR